MQRTFDSKIVCFAFLLYSFRIFFFFFFSLFHVILLMIRQTVRGYRARDNKPGSDKTLKLHFVHTYLLSLYSSLSFFFFDTCSFCTLLLKYLFSKLQMNPCQRELKAKSLKKSKLILTFVLEIAFWFMEVIQMRNKKTSWKKEKLLEWIS